MCSLALVPLSLAVVFLALVDVAIAAVCEAAGALIAGGDVVATVSSGIINPELMPSPAAFTTAMLAALFAAALWINLATWIGAPVSTTHSVVGGVLGGTIAAGFLACIKFTITDVPDRLEQARRRVPLLVAVMAGALSTYLLMKGLSRVVSIASGTAVMLGGVALLITWWLVWPCSGPR